MRFKQGPVRCGQVHHDGKDQNRNGVLRTADTMLRHARRQPHPPRQQHTTRLPLYNRPTNDNNLPPTPAPLGERKLNRVRGGEYASGQASPVARASSSRLKPTEIQPPWIRLQDKASGPAPGGDTMGPTPMNHPLKGDGCETLVQHGLPLLADPDDGYCSRRPCPSPSCRSCFVGALELGPSGVSQSPEVRIPLGATPVPT